MKTVFCILVWIVVASGPVLAENTNITKSAAVVPPFDLSGLPATPPTDEEQRVLSTVRAARNSSYTAHATLARYYKEKGDLKRATVEQKRADYWGAIKIPAPATNAQPSVGANTLLAGIWRVRSANVGGAGGTPNLSPLVLQADGTYTFSSANGTYKVADDTITFSEMKIHPTGRLSGNSIIFEYDYNGLHQTLTFYHAGGAPVSADSSSTSGSRREIALNLTVRFPPNQDGYIGWMNTLTLVPTSTGGGPLDQNCVRGSQPHTLQATFPTVPTCSIYDVVADASGGAKVNVGQLDLRNPSPSPTLTLTVEAQMPAK